jgi:hypothetical protein
MGNHKGKDMKEKTPKGLGRSLDDTCDFCKQPGHYKAQCPKYAALSTSTGYGRIRAKLSNEKVYVFDLLEDSVDSGICANCLSDDCDWTKCTPPVETYLFQEASNHSSKMACGTWSLMQDKPYSYELLPEYANGSKKFPTVKSMNWEGKSATAKVIRGFTESTPVVQRCPNPRSISRLVIVSKLAPGQAKDDPDHGFRVCVNALINKCIKPDASTIPLAVDEIKKLAHCKYFLQLDGANAYWSIPVCEESMRLTAFHTPDGLYCWNRLLMGAKPSSAVQQSAYLEALDNYIDFYEDGTLKEMLVG